MRTCLACLEPWMRRRGEFMDERVLSLDLTNYGAVRTFDLVDADLTPQGAVFYADVSLANTLLCVLTVDCEYRAGVLVPKKLTLTWPNRRPDIHNDSPMPGAQSKISG
jgi:hypothetical protein